MVDVDSETLFNVAAAIISTIAALMFVLNVDLGYSPVSKIALVLLFLAVVFAVAQRTDDRQLTVLGYGVVVTSAVALLFDVAETFRVEDALTVLGLLAVAGLLFFLRTRLGEDEHLVSGRQASRLLGAVAVLAAAVLVVDVVTGGLAYELRPESQIEYPDSAVENREQLRIATVVATNPTPFPERVEAPRYEVCAAGNWSAYRPPSGEGEPERRVHVHANVEDGYNEHVFGFGQKAYPVTLHVQATNVEGESFPVRTTDECPGEETGEPYVALFEAPEDRGYRGFAL